MARIRTHPIPWPDKTEVSNYKDMRHGAVDDAFWDEDEPVDFPKRGKGKSKIHFKGCPENNGKAHVYIWVDTIETSRYEWFNPPKTVRFLYSRKTCCGCGKVKNSKFKGRI